MKKLEEFKNIHINEDIYVIGSGSSLNYIDKSFFENKITIFMNLLNFFVNIYINLVRYYAFNIVIQFKFRNTILYFLVFN